MTVSTLNTSVLATGNGVTTVFPYTFEADNAADVKVARIVNNAVINYTVGTEYFVTLGVGNVGGNVTFFIAPDNGEQLYIYRDTPKNQLIGVSPQQAYDPKVVEAVWDKLTFIVQELAVELSKAIKASPTQDPANLVANIFSAEAAAVAAAATAVAVQNSLPILPQLSGKNLIINGQGRINQRGYVSGTPTVGANQYTLDRWRVDVSGQSLTFTGNNRRRVMTAPAGGVTQIVEGVNIDADDYLLNWFGTATCQVNGVTRAKGEVFSLPNNTDVTVRFINGTFSDVQMELGPLPTTLEALTYGDELFKCMRYYWQHDVGSGTANMYMDAARNNCFIRRGTFPVPMRANPTATFTAPSLVNCNTFTVSPTGGTNWLERVNVPAAGLYNATSYTVFFDAEL